MRAGERRHSWQREQLMRRLRRGKREKTSSWTSESRRGDTWASRLRGLIIQVARTLPHPTDSSKLSEAFDALSGGSEGKPGDQEELAAVVRVIWAGLAPGRWLEMDCIREVELTALGDDTQPGRGRLPMTIQE